MTKEEIEIENEEISLREMVTPTALDVMNLSKKGKSVAEGVTFLSAVSVDLLSVALLVLPMHERDKMLDELTARVKLQIAMMEGRKRGLYQ